MNGVTDGFSCVDLSEELCWRHAADDILIETN